MYLHPKGRDWSLTVLWDDLAIIYATIIVTWTVLLTCGILWLVLNRRLPAVRIRNLQLAVASTGCLHVYLVKIFLAYTTNGHFLCSAEYWIMCIYLPFGIALFQAYLVQLRSVWDLQQRLLSKSSSDISIKVSRWDLRERWRGLSHLQRSYCVIASGLLVQLIITTVLYATTPTLQGDWKSYGKISYAKGQGLCRKSLPWIPSAFWQLFWSWIYGPYTIFESRNIQDTHWWRLQVTISVIAGLPGTPMWLTALYAPVMKPINLRFVPPMWLAPGIMVMQFVTVFFPVFESLKAKSDQRKTLATLKAWEAHLHTSESPRSSSMRPKSFTSSYVDISPTASNRICQMASLRLALAQNPKPLLEFAATKDFSAENILFLLHVRRWRSAWVQESLPQDAIDVLFTEARAIFLDFVNDKTADFPINIGSKTKRGLIAIFEPSLPVSDEKSDYKFDDSNPDNLQSIVSKYADMQRALEGLKTPPTRAFQPLFDPHPCVEPLGRAKAAISPEFGPCIFDEAETSIEYLVLTNVWQKFVKSSGVMQARDAD